MLVRLGRAVAVVLWLAGCAEREPQEFSYYEERIAPILDSGCQRQTTGCHVDDGTGFALGNLDLTSYDSLMRRRDLLPAYGPYPEGLLLLKAGDSVRVRVQTLDPPDPDEPERRYVTVETDIRHGGGEGAIAQGSDDHAALKRWIDGGHTRTGVSRIELRENEGRCRGGVGRLEGLDLDAEPADDESLEAFESDVEPVLQRRCAGSSCHGSRVADLYLTCGDDARERRWNYELALRHLDEVAVTSELLRRPLSLAAGGAYHEGGDVFENTEEPDYRALLEWARDVAERRPELLRWDTEDAGLRFFANRVQPVLVRKGCMFLNCHSTAMFHDLRLRGGTRGHFSEVATRRNHEMSKLMLALESRDPNNSRMVAKNLCPADTGGAGVRHRGGALFEDFGGCAREEKQARASLCEGVDADGGDLNEVPAYCVLARWHEIEREQAIARGEIDGGVGPRALAWVERPEDVGGVLDFHEFRPGADLRWAEAIVSDAGELALGPARSLLSACGLPIGIDARNPAVSWDGTRLAFAARQDEADVLRLYELRLEDERCEPVAGLDAGEEVGDGIPIHDFDPAYAPDGRLVFASTRGYLDGGGDYRGPTRTPAALAPNSNLYVYDSDAEPPVRQLTYLLDQELSPSFMADGRVIFSAEKRALGFHQLAGRRQNLDGGDYHPLFAQRPSIGFESATEIVELPNRNLAMVAAPLDAADGGGAIVVVNRSIGPDQDDRAPDDRAYVHSLTAPAEGAFGGGSGVFRSPAPLPTGRILASCDLEATSLGSGSRRYSLCEIDPRGGRPPRVVHTPASGVAVEPVAIYARSPAEVFRSRIDEVNGSTRVDADAEDAVIHILDVPLLGTLLFSNTREGRPIDFRVAGVELLESRPPPGDARDFADLGGDVVEDDFGRFYQSQRSLGSAPLAGDGSVRVRVPGGMPLSLALQDPQGEVLAFGGDDPFAGPMRQREALQFYPGERAKQSIPRRFFNGLCGGCHGSISGRELDVVVDVDVLTSASRTLSSDEMVDLR